MLHKKTKPIAVHPGEILTMLIKEHGVTQTLLASALGVPQTKISQICNGKLGISAEMSLKLEKAMGMKAKLWLSLQKNWELSQVSVDKLKKVKKLRLTEEPKVAA